MSEEVELQDYNFNYLEIYIILIEFHYMFKVEIDWWPERMKYTCSFPTTLGPPFHVSTA